MAFKYKVDILAALKDKGFSSYRIRKESIINQSALQKLRSGKMIAWDQLNIVCSLLDCQLSDIIVHIKDE
jgi:putative transcriptional regulator